MRPPSRASRAAAVLGAAVAVGLAPGAVARAAPARNRIDAAAVDALATAGLRAVADLQRPDGRLDDPTGRLVGGPGLPTLAWVAVHQAEHAAEDDDRTWRLELAERTLARGDGGSVIQKWPLAMMVAQDLGDLPEDLREMARRRVERWRRLHAAGIASDRCFQRPACFNNYRLADAVLNLELARSGLHSDVPGARLADPAGLARRTIAWLDAAVPPVTPVTGAVIVPGRAPRRAAILSDPGTLPLAYAALCTAWAVRATRLVGHRGNGALREATRRALWGLLGVAAPDGEVGWSGRGADQLWSLTATLYAAAEGSALYDDEDPVLSRRLRRLADVEGAAVAGRLDDDGLAVLPSGNRRLAGLDHYYSVTGSVSLALVWLELARDVLPDPGAPRLALPSEIDGGAFADLAHTGLVVRRVGRSWLALHLRRDHVADPREDFGPARALRLEGGRWHEQRVAQPAPRPGAATAPVGGPVLHVGRRPFIPRARGWRPIRGGVELEGVWQSRGGPARPARWRYTASARGVLLQSPCPPGQVVTLTSWFPTGGTFRHTNHLLARDGFGLALSLGGATRSLRARWANSRQGELMAGRATVRCHAPLLLVRWTGPLVPAVRP